MTYIILPLRGPYLRRSKVEKVTEAQKKLLDQEFHGVSPPQNTKMIKLRKMKSERLIGKLHISTDFSWKL